MKPDVCYRSFVPLYEIVVYSFCKVLKYVVLEGKLCPPRCDTYLSNIHYCCPLTEAESVTKDCASRRSRLQNGQASLRKHVWISGHESQLPENVEFNYTVFYLVRALVGTKTVTCFLLIQGCARFGEIWLFFTEQLFPLPL